MRCDAGPVPERGTGHLVRDLLLAAALRERGAEVSLCGRYDEYASDRIRAAGLPFEEARPDEAESELLHRAVIRREPDVLVLDLLGTEVEDVAAVHDLVPVIVTFDDQQSGARLADMAINPIVGGEGPYSSYDHLVLSAPEPKPVETDQRPHVVVSMGGHDHRQIGPKLAAGLAQRIDADITLIVSARQPASELDGVTVVQEPPNFSTLLQSADVAVLNGGLTLLEAVANGIPAVAVPQYPHQAATIKRLSQRGAVVGAADSIDDSGVDDELANRVCTAVLDLVQDGSARERLRQHALEAIDGRGLARVVELLMVVERLAWDSAFFGVQIARIYPLRLTERLLSFALARCEEMGIECVYYLSDCHHAESVRLAEAAGFHFVDIRLTLERPVPVEARPQPAVRDAVPDDVPTLRRIAERLYVHSRYWFDRQFPRADCERFYAEWIAKCVSGDQASRTFVFDPSGNGPLGYIAVSRLSSVVASIVLLGVDEAARGIAAGSALIEHALSWARDEGCSTMEVVTQGRNYEAQRAYQRAGFVTKKTELWYHLWRR